jgi:hypothetical protein
MLAHRFFYVSLGILALMIAYHLGAAATAATSSMDPSPTEVAVRTGTVGNGETSPLPVYSDGTEALESECRWIATPRHPQETFRISYPYNNRVVEVNGGPTQPIVAYYMIIATRGVQANATQSTSWGSVKSAYTR